MPEVRFRGSDGSAVSVPITVGQADAPWPFVGAGAPAQPILPTGLTVVTNGPYANVNGREYRGGDFDDVITAQRVVFRNAHFSWFGIQNPADEVWLVNCDVGPRGQGIHPQIASGFQAAQAQRVVVFGGRFHGMHQATAQDHTEGLQVGGVSVLWVKGAVFEDNHVMNTFLRSWVPAPVRWVVLEDCVLKDTAAVGGPAFNSVLVAGDDDTVKPTDVVIRNCLSNMPISVNGSAVRVTVTGTQPITAANLAAREQRLASWRGQYGLPAQSIAP